MPHRAIVSHGIALILTIVLELNVLQAQVQQQRNSPFEVHLDEKVLTLLSEVEQLYGKPIRVERLGADIQMAGKARVDDDGTPIVLLKPNSARRIDVIAHELYHLLIQSRDGYPLPKWDPPPTIDSNEFTFLRDQFTFRLYDPILHRAFFREARDRLGIDPGEDFEQQVRQMISDGSIKRMDDGAVVLNYYKTRLELKDRKLFQQLVDGWENQGKHNQVVIGELLATIVEQVNPLTPVNAVSALVECLNIFYKGRYTFVQRSWEQRQRGTYTQNLAIIEFRVARTTASQGTTAPGTTNH